VLTDGQHCVALATSQDHKTRDEDDQGPNTGGMGAYSPAPIITEQLADEIMTRVIWPTIKGMAAEGNIFRGFLYAGLMIEPNNSIKVLEFNCRLGDPETQVILPRIQSDFADLCQQAIDNKLESAAITWNNQAALGVVLTAEGYPDHYQVGDEISGLNQALDQQEYIVFHAGTKILNHHVVTNGGRVLCVAALGDTLQQAKNLAYAGVKQIHWRGMYYRRDIGDKGLK
jgi:phosphoribosylamine--glycine ligase